MGNRADRRHHGLLYQVNFARLGVIGGVDDGAFFHLRDFAGDTDNDARVHQHLSPMRFLNEVIQHALSDFEVGDHAILHGADGDDIARRAPEHFLGFLAYRFYLSSGLVNRDNGGLVHHNAFAFGVDQRVGRAQIDGKIGRKETE